MDSADTADSAGDTDFDVFYHACATGDDTGLKTLMRAEDFKLEYLNALHKDTGLTGLMVAVVKGHTEVVKVLLSAVADLSHPRKEITLYTVSGSGATVFDMVREVEIRTILYGELARRLRLDSGEIKYGFHETSLEAYQWIVADYKKGKFPMVGGNGGYFGGGVYFAATQEESAKKALSHGHGFQCRLKMGTCYFIETFGELTVFRQKYCSGDSYQTPVDVLQRRLLVDGYDSVWGHFNPDKEESQRILKTGDEYVVYSADQIELRDVYAVVKQCRLSMDYGMGGLEWKPYSLRSSIHLVKPWRSARYKWVKHSLTHPEMCMDVERLKEWNGDAIVSGDVFDFKYADKQKENGASRATVYLDRHAYQQLVRLVDYYPLVHPLHPLSFNPRRLYFGKHPPLFLTELLMEELGFSNLQELYLHYRELLAMSSPKVYIQLYQHESIKVGMEATQILRWDEVVFPDVVEDELYALLRDHFEDRVSLFVCQQGVVFVYYDPEFYMSSVFPVADLDGLLSERMGVFDVNRYLAFQWSPTIQKAILAEFGEKLKAYYETN